jgi:hypothetical protein
MEDDSLARSIRESIWKLTRAPGRTTTPYVKAEQNLRDSIRALSRSRVSQLLRQLRAAHGYSYAQVQTDTGLSQQVIFDVEFKDRRLTFDELRRLAECYHVSVNDILGVEIE